MLLEYWFALWQEMFRPTDVFAGFRGERSSGFVYCISLFFFMLSTSSMEIPGSGNHSHSPPRQTRNKNRPSPQYYMGMVRAITKVLNEMKM